MDIGKKYSVRIQGPDGKPTFFTGTITGKNGPLYSMCDKFGQPVEFNENSVVSAKEI